MVQNPVGYEGSTAVSWSRLAFLVIEHMDQTDTCSAEVR